MRYLILLGALAAAILGYWFYWDHVADRALAETRGWIAREQAQGLAIQHGPLSVSGFPYRVTVNVPAARLASAAKADPGWRVAGDLALNIQPWQFNHMVLQGHNLHAATWRADETAPGDATAFEARASIVADKGQWQRITIDAKNPAIARPVATLTADRLLASTRRNSGEDKDRPADTFDVALTAERLSVPPTTAPGFPPVIDRFDAVGQLSGALQRGNLRDALEAWRQSGGILDLSKVTLLWGGIDIAGDGTLTVDREFRPLAALSATVRGYDRIVDALAASGQLRTGDAGLAKFALAALSQKEGKNPPFIKTSISAQDGRLTIGPVPVARLRPVIAE